ncbi:MAG: MFS transporter [Spirochaetaceae bacterium]
MLTKFLSEEEKKIGQKKLYTFQAFNGMAFNFMGATPVYLLAIGFGATNIELGYISSVIFLTGFILVILPKLLAGKNLIKVQSTAWFLRGMFVLIYLALFFLEGRSAVLLILIVYTLFCSARMVGVVIENPLIKMVTTSGNRGIVFAKLNIAFQSTALVSKLISFIITSFKLLSGTTGILLLQVFGSIINTAAVLQFRKIPCRETVEYHKSRNLFVIFKESMHNKKRKYPLLFRWISICVMVLNGLTIVFLRKEVGITANYIFLYTMIIAFANILSGLFTKNYSDRIGSRPLLIGMNILLSIFLIIWMLLPGNNISTIPKYMFFILGLLTNFFLLSNNVLINRVLVNTMPETDSFAYNSMIKFITAIFSFLTGILGGILIDAGQSWTQLLPNNFSLMFLLMFILSMVMVILSLKIIDVGSLSAKETMAILFSSEGLRAYNDIGKLDTIKDPVKIKNVILSISQNDANIATEELRSILASPLSPHKGDVIKSLFSHPRDALLPQILDEASDSGSYHQKKAIFALGAYSDTRVENILIKLLDDKNSAIRSTAAKSLGRIGYKQNIDKITKLSLDAIEAWDKINYLIALKNMDEEGNIFKQTFIYPREYTDGIFRQTYYSLVSALFDFKPKLSNIYSSNNQKKGDGLKDFLQDTRDLDLFNVKHHELIKWFKSGNKNRIWEFCYSVLKDKRTDNSTPLNNLLSAIVIEADNKIKSSENDILYDDAIAALYFTYQILITA